MPEQVTTTKDQADGDARIWTSELAEVLYMHHGNFDGKKRMILPES